MGGVRLPRFASVLLVAGGAGRSNFSAAAGFCNLALVAGAATAQNYNANQNQSRHNNFLHFILLEVNNTPIWDKLSRNYARV